MHSGNREEGGDIGQVNLTQFSTRGVTHSKDFHKLNICPSHVQYVPQGAAREVPREPQEKSPGLATL